MNLIKLEDLNVLSLHETRKKLYKKFDKVLLDEENNEIREELNADKIKSNLVNNVIPKFEKWVESSRRNTQFLRPTYIPIIRTTNFSFGFITRKTTSFKEISLTPISQTGYILNINEA